MKQSLAIFLHGSRYDRIYQAVNISMTAAAQGWKCYLFLFFDALASFMDGKWDEVDLTRGENQSASDPAAVHRLEKLGKGFESANLPSLYDVLEDARRDYGLTVCACSASVKLLDLAPTEVKKKIDEVVGLPTMLQIASKVTHVLYI
jgi:peroxiredoxin family protein